MSRVSNALNMYFLLQSRPMMKIEEIANELEVTPSMVKNYKNDLEMAGIYVGSKLGRYGGYYLENKRSLDALNLTIEELSALKMAKETIISGKYHYGLKFETLVSKIVNSKSNEGEEVYYHNKSINEADEIIEKEKKVWIAINIAINQKKKISMQYKSLKEHGIEIKERLVEPYGVFDYKGATYFYGYCGTAQDIRFFKLSRILEFRIVKETFDVKVDFNFDSVLEKSFGIYTDQVIDLKLKIFYPMSEIIREKQISKTQKITEIGQNTILFEAKMTGYTEIKTWVMSMASNVVVIEPISLREDIKQEIDRITNRYL